MGAKYSPALANLYMAHWEEIYIFSVLNPFAPHIMCYGRYIDDLLLVWEGTGVQAEVFVQYMNSNNSNFKFTHIFHETKVHFLDITLEGDMTNGVVISPYRKSMSRNATLLATSCHPKHVVENIPLGELVRTKRNCTHLDTFFKQQDSVCERLQARR